MAEAADLGAEDWIFAGCCRSEVNVQSETGDGVLLESHAGDEESVNDVVGAQTNIDFAAGGENKFAADDVVVALWVFGIETEGIACSGVDELRLGCAECCVLTGVAEVPLELYADDFDLHGGWRGSLEAICGPEFLRGDRHPDVEAAECDEGKQLGAKESGQACFATAFEECDSEEKVGEQKENRDDDEVGLHQPVEGEAVERTVGRHPERR